jgi:hypothetical protein
MRRAAIAAAGAARLMDLVFIALGMALGLCIVGAAFAAIRTTR